MILQDPITKEIFNSVSLVDTLQFNLHNEATDEEILRKLRAIINIFGAEDICNAYQTPEVFLTCPLEKAKSIRILYNEDEALIKDKDLLGLKPHARVFIAKYQIKLPIYIIC